MIVLGKKDVTTLQWLRSFVHENIGEGQERLLERLDQRVGNYIELCKIEPPVTLTDEDVENIENCLHRINTIVDEYSTGTSTLSIDTLEILKRKMSAEMGYLTTLKEEMQYQANVLEEYSKKQFRAHLIQDISDSQRISINQAEKIVEQDTRYVSIRKQALLVTKFAAKLKTKYSVYSQTWSSIIQSISVLSKENYNRTSN